MGTRGTANFKRIYNMCSSHAVLYLSQKYIDAAVNIIEAYLNAEVPLDVALPSIHKDFKILTPNSPYFYQKDQPELTNLSLEV